MKRNFILGMTLQAFVLAFGLTVFAQNNENQAMIEVVNDPMPAAKIQSGANTQSQTQSINTPLVLQNQPQITQTQPAIVYVQKQATTVVEDTPLTESAADKLRKKRVEIEQQTESKIVEKLEESRMRAEEERAAKLLSGLEEKKEEKKAEAVVAAPVVAPVVVAPQEVQAVQVVAPQEPVIVQQSQVNNEPAIEVKSELAKANEDEKKSKKMYVGLDAGVVSYNAKNIKTSGALGFTVGSLIDEKFIVEGSFLYAKSDVESITRQGLYNPNTGQYYPTIIAMKEYGFSGALKYRLLKTKLSPYVGGLLSYTHRDYKDSQYFDTQYALESSSWAIDAGLIIGADVRLTDAFTIGADFKYIRNISYDVNTKGLKSSYNQAYGFDANPVEELGTYTFLINAKFTF
jgi:hypothetical protein